MKNKSRFGASSKMHAAVLAMALAVFGGSAALAQAQSSAPDIHPCFSPHVDEPGELDKRIAACLEVIGDSVLGPAIRARAYRRRAESYAQKADPADQKRAIADLSEAIRLVPDIPERQSQFFYLRGGIYLRLRDHDRALDDFGTLIRLQPGSVSGYMARGTVSAAKGDPRSAILDYTEAIRLDPKLARAYAQRALSHLKSDAPTQALSDISRVLALDANDAASYGTRGLIYLALDRRDDAIADFRKAISMDPNDLSIKRILERAERARMGAPAPAENTGAAAVGAAVADPHAGERHDYELAARVGTRPAWEAFLKAYSNGFYADLARAQLTKLGIAGPDRAKAEREEAERLRAENDRLAREEAERARLEKARLTREAAERERLDKERTAREQAERERMEKERLARERAERDRLAKEQAAREREEKDRVEKDRVEGIEQAERDKATTEAAGKIRKVELTPPGDGPAVATPLRALSGSALVREIKKELKRVGCYAGPIDDSWTTPQTGAAVKKFVKAAGASAAPGEPTMDFLDALRGKSGRVCSLECRAREVESAGRCVAKTCKSGFDLDDDGNCVRQKSHDKKAERSRAERSHVSIEPSREASPSADREPAAGGERCGAKSCSAARNGCMRHCAASKGRHCTPCADEYSRCMQTGTFIGKKCQLSGLARN